MLRQSSKEKKRQSLGRIYTTKREPLSQMIHYPKSVLIDPYYLDHSHTKPKITSKQKQKKQKVIKFIGDQQQNIEQIIMQMDSLVQSENRIFMQKQRLSVEKQLVQILKIFYSKIDKLRAEREGYKAGIVKERGERERVESQMGKQVEKLMREVMQMRKQKQRLVENYQNQQKKSLFYERQCMMLQQRAKANNNSNHVNMFNQTNAQSCDDIVNRSTNDYFPFEDILLMDHYSISTKKPTHHRNENHSRFPSDLLYSDENQPSFSNYQPINKNLQKSIKAKNHFTQQSQSESNLIQEEIQQMDKNKISQQEKQKLQSLLKKHNLQPHQLEGIIEEYLKDLKEQYQKQFQNQEEKSLYLLAKKMDARIWNKKVKKDIQKIISSKESIKMKG